MSQPFDKQEEPSRPRKKSAHEWFEEMAALIERNKGENFGGAFVLVPPGEEEPMVGLILSNDTAQFWGTVSSKLAIRLQAIDLEQRKRGAFG